MLEFIQSPIYDNWFKQHIPQNSLIICTPYIKQGALDHVWEDFDLDNRLSDIKLDMLIRGNTEEFTVNRSSDINVLHKFHKISNSNVTFKRISNLHMKAYLVDEKYLLITSGNLTNSGMFAVSGKENFEGGIATDDEDTIKKFLEYFNHIWRQGEELEVFYNDIIEKYNEYIASFTSKVKLPRKRKKYNFPVSQAKTQTKYSLPELPSAKIDTLKKTLDVLMKSKSALSRYELGRRLRSLENADDLDNSVNNNKYGEEKGNLAVYFGLATQYKEKGISVYVINDTGKTYVNSSSADKIAYLLDQSLSKAVLCDIREQMQNDNFDLRKCIYSICDGTESTLDRKVAPVRSLLDLFTVDGAAKTIL